MRAPHLTPSLSPRLTAAVKLVKQFEARASSGVFSGIVSKDVADALTERLGSAVKIDQDQTSLCGPAVVMFNLTRDDPLKYAQFVIDLFERGRAQFGNLDITVHDHLKQYVPPPRMINVADWIALASLRDSRQFFLRHYKSVKDDLAAMTYPGAIVEWFQKAGYPVVLNETHLTVPGGSTRAYYELSRVMGTGDRRRGSDPPKPEINARKASDLHKQGYMVCLLIHSNMLEIGKQRKASPWANHWIVLISPVKFYGTYVECTVYSWGAEYYVALPNEDFAKNYYGFVAARAY